MSYENKKNNDSDEEDDDSDKQDDDSDEETYNSRRFWWRNLSPSPRAWFQFITQPAGLVYTGVDPE